jgi:hypothetical protein
MPKPPRPSLLLLALSLAACAGTAACNSAGSSPTPVATASRDSATIDHPTGSTDVVLRFEEGGGFVPVDFIATQAPTFTLYGDGTVVFRNATTDAPPDARDDVFRSIPFRAARLSEEQVQGLLDRAINRGGLGIAKPRYDPGTVADAPTATFTLNAGSIKKVVSVVALGIETPPSIDSQTLAALSGLGTLLRDFDPNGTSGAGPYRPEAYRVQLWDAGGPVANAPRPWPWPGLAPSDFKAPADQPGGALLRRVMSPDEVSALGLSGLEGGAQGLALKGPDGKTYSVAIRPLLPDENA